MSKTDKRNDILNAAMTLFAEQGFHGAPMAQISERAGVGAGTIYRYFKNRDVLIMEIHTTLFDKFTNHLKERYPHGRPVRECFFHIGKGIIDYFIKQPLEFRYNEQFHHSPYGLEVRRNKLTNTTGEHDIVLELYEKGMEYQVIKPIPMALFFDLAIAPIFWAVRDHHQGFIKIDNALSETIVSSCWDSIRI
ncbi:MAG: TetR/AcrR family transcriptional regulator [Proteobacteria bacterium]|nr:TetR/AcrR family transcriptional regulator [Pseudomonadota bacterium]